MEKVLTFFRLRPRLMGLVFAIGGVIGLFALPIEARNGEPINLWLIFFAPIFALIGPLFLLAPRKYWLEEETGPVFAPSLKRLAAILCVVGMLLGFVLMFGYYKISLLTNTYHVESGKH